MQELALESAINSIRVRFGSQALTRAAEMPPPQPWWSGTPVDHLTGIGGVPRGRLSLFTGSGTCGKLTLALALLARATHEFAHSIVIDGGGFDPWTLTPFSPELGALTVVRAPAPEVVGEAAATLARAGAGFLLLLGDVPEHWLGPLESAANRSGTVVIGVVDAPNRALAHASSFSLGFTRTDWIYERDLLVGLRMSVRCLKNRVAAPVGETELEVRYPISFHPLADFTPGVSQAPRVVMEVETFASAVV
jgi:recA bacterial DNA recombination protein